MKFTISSPVAAADICYLVVGAIEGGSSYWCRSYEHLVIPPDVPKDGVVPYGHPEFWEGDFVIKFTYDNPDDDGLISKEIRPENLQVGLQTFADKYPSHYGDWVSENYDAETSDVFLQCLLLGDVVYG